MELVTGRAGSDHISSADLAAMYRGLLVADDVVLAEGDQLSCTMLNANTAQIGTGSCMLQAHHARVETAEQVTIDSGSPGYKRNDLIVARYTLGDGNIQAVYLDVIKGTAVAGTASDPAYTDGDIDGGDTLVEFPLWRIPIDGVNVGTPVRIMPTIDTLQAQITALGESVSQISDRNTTAFNFDNATTITRVGHAVMLTLVASTRNAIGTWVDTKICTVSPAPKAVTYAVSRTNDGETGLVQINVDGNVYFRTMAKAAVSGESLRTTTVYLCD